MQFLPLLWPDTVTDKLPQTQEIRHFPLITPSRVTSKLPSPHGTRGQKVRHLPGGSSDLIHRCFCPLDCNWKYINTSHNISSLLKRLHRMFCKHHGQTIQSLNFLNKSFLLPLYHKAHCNK